MITAYQICTTIKIKTNNEETTFGLPASYLITSGTNHFRYIYFH